MRKDRPGALAEYPTDRFKPFASLPAIPNLVLWRGVAAGTIVGLALGLMIALFIAMKPERFAGLIQ
jgi:hypothetical protein